MTSSVAPVCHCSLASSGDRHCELSLLASKQWHTGLLLFVVFLAPGCAGTPLPPEADADRASAALRTGLEAWKKGEKPESLQRGAPAIYFTDLRWNAGDQLLDYSLSEATERFGQSVRCSVVLELQGASGKRTQKKATYLIDTDAANVVIVPGDM